MSFKHRHVVHLLLFLGLNLVSAPAWALTVLCLGDSLTEGYGIAKTAAFPALVETALKAKGYQDLQVINGGISGSTSASGLGRLRWHLKGKGETKPDVMILALGANDGLRGLDVAKTKANLAAVIDLAKKNNITVLLAGMKMPPNYGSDYTKRFEDIFPALAKEYHVALMPFLLQDVATVSKLNQADGIHPNREGHLIVAKTVEQYLEPILKGLKKSPK